MQVLLKQEQEQKLLFIKENTFTQDIRSEEHFKKIDEKLSLIQEQMNEIAATRQESKKVF